MIKNRGIALLELVLATAILGTVLVALGVAVGRSVWALSASDCLQVALDLAQERYAEWKTDAVMEDEIKPSSYDGEKELNHRKFTWQHQIEATDHPKIFQSTIIIRWKEGGREQERIFVSLVPHSLKVRK